MESPYFETETFKETSSASATAILTTKRHTRSSSKKGSEDVKNSSVNPPLAKISKTRKNKLNKTVVALAAETSGGPVIKTEETKSEKWMPENWEEILNNIREMRKERDAPVDNMGCEQCPDKSCPPEVRRFQILVSLMLSSQTRDQMTHAATEKLKEHGLTIQNILDTDEEVIAKLIYPVGFWRRKASYLKKTAAILAEQYNYDIPNTVEQLCKLPGVGQKMAVLCVNIAWQNIVGIGVDTHVHRISNRLGWTKTPTKTPHETEKDLEDWIPRHLWEEVNVLLVGFGQQKCTPLRPQCGTCLNRYICPTGKTWIPSPAKEKRNSKDEGIGSPDFKIKLES